MSLLVAGDTILLDPKIGLYPMDVAQKTLHEFQFKRSSPDQFVSEIPLQVVDGWKRVFPEYLTRESPFMTSVKYTPWGQMEIPKPVARLAD